MEYKLTPKYFEELNVGDKFITPSRTVTETDIVNFAGLSGDYNLIHTDEEYAKSMGFERRVAYGLLTIAIAHGLLFRLGLLDVNSLAFLGLETKFTHWVLPGDTISCLVEVINKRQTKKPDRGILTLKIQVFNQRQELVAEATQTSMYACIPKQVKNST